MIPWLSVDDAFPPVVTALRQPNGLLAAGADLSCERLLSAYSQGIFPWYSAGEPLLWWSPDPRMVLFPQALKISRSLAKTLRHGDYQVRLDTAFTAVMNACATTPRAGQQGTWITPEMQAAYGQLFERGYAHSVETWVNQRLVGGLYGVAIGGVFFGESMFSHVNNASKIALAHLCRYLSAQEFGIIDCQMESNHLKSLCAQAIARSDYLAQLQRLSGCAALPGRWPADGVADAYRRLADAGGRSKTESQ